MGARVLGAGSRGVEMGAGRLKLEAGGRTNRGDDRRIRVEARTCEVGSWSS